jgi:membrane-associated phospholipid phosphatase
VLGLEHMRQRLRPDWLSRAPRLTWADALWILIPATIWITLHSQRSQLIYRTCLDQPKACDASTLNPVDRWAYEPRRDDWADRWSFITQDSSGWMGIGIPIALHSARLVSGFVPAAAFTTQLAADVVLSLQAVVVTGMLTEAAKVSAARPRPYMFFNRKEDRKNPTAYTSFFSGHTSFAAASSASTALILLSRWAPMLPRFTRWFSLFSLLYWLSFTVSTGYFRVKAGVHFTTDVVVGAIIGSTVAFLVARLHRRRQSKDLSA